MGCKSFALLFDDIDQDLQDKQGRSLARILEIIKNEPEIKEQFLPAAKARRSMDGICPLSQVYRVIDSLSSSLPALNFYL